MPIVPRVLPINLLESGARRRPYQVERCAQHNHGNGELSLDARFALIPSRLPSPLLMCACASLLCFLSQRVYIGNLDPNVNKDELIDICNAYGKLADVWVARNPPGFAFVTLCALPGSELCAS